MMSLSTKYDFYGVVGTWDTCLRDVDGEITNGSEFTLWHLINPWVGCWIYAVITVRSRVWYFSERGTCIRLKHDAMQESAG